MNLIYCITVINKLYINLRSTDHTTPGGNKRGSATGIFDVHEMMTTNATNETHKNKFEAMEEAVTRSRNNNKLIMAKIERLMSVMSRIMLAVFGEHAAA